MVENTKAIFSPKVRDCILISFLVLNIGLAGLLSFSAGALMGVATLVKEAEKQYDLGVETGGKKARYELYLDLHTRGIGEYKPMEGTFKYHKP